MLRRLLLILTLILPVFPAFSGEKSAKQLFGGQPLPAALPSAPIGFYSRGCMAGGVQLPPDGPTWEAMRLSRNRQWGLPVLVDFIETLSRDAAEKDGWPGLLVGDMSQPRGGPMASGHASHQIGLDVDIWLNPMPARRYTEQERESVSAIAMTDPGPHLIFQDRWTPAHLRVLRRAALDPRVERIFVAPGIKKELCDQAGNDRDWLRKIRPYYDHHDHFHVRLSCPAGTNCRAQSPPPPGDGCGADLNYWFTAEPYKPAPEPAKPPKQVMLADLPPACAGVLDAPAVEGAMTMREAFAGNTVSPAAPVVVSADAGSAPQAGATPRLPRPRPAGR